MAHAANIRTFRRSRISPTEKVISGSILFLLIAIGSIVLTKGNRYDPATYTGDPDALESTRFAVEGKAATVRNEGDLRTYELSGTVASSAPPNMANAIPALIEGLIPMGPTETYNAETLYEKINGRAPAYLEYNFQELTSRSFTLPAASGEYVDTYLFRMDSPLNAFGIFSTERDLTAAPLDFAVDGYRSEMGIFLRMGDVYAQILASSTSPIVMKEAEAFARALGSFLPSDNSGMEGRLLLPDSNQVPGSLIYINDNAYGQSVLNSVFEARYKVGDHELTLFAQAAPDSESAQANWSAMRDFFSKYGTIHEVVTIEGADLFSAEMFGEWSLVYVRDQAVSGVMNASDLQAARNFLQSQLTPSTDYSGGYE